MLRHLLKNTIVATLFETIRSHFGFLGKKISWEEEEPTKPRFLTKEAIETDAYRLAFVGDITEIKQIIVDNLSSCIVSVCKRDSDRVAHALDAFGCNLPSGCYNTWEGVPRDFEN